jgi:hypothetical protein
LRKYHFAFGGGCPSWGKYVFTICHCFTFLNLFVLLRLLKNKTAIAGILI